jgi:hypothetical protein
MLQRSQYVDRQPAPRTVGGEVARGGPVVPAVAPRPIPGLSAHQLFVQWALVAGGAFFVAIIGVLTGIVDGPAVAVIALAWLALAAFLLARVRRRFFAELAAGYTTLVLAGGGLWFSRSGYWGRSFTRVPWDFSGCWQLADDGAVRAAPDRDGDPPGFYPSPYQPGRRELWTGAVWSGRFKQ